MKPDSKPTTISLCYFYTNPRDEGLILVLPSDSSGVQSCLPLRPRPVFQSLDLPRVSSPPYSPLPAHPCLPSSPTLVCPLPSTLVSVSPFLFLNFNTSELHQQTRFMDEASQRPSPWSETEASVIAPVCICDPTCKIRECTSLIRLL